MVVKITVYLDYGRCPSYEVVDFKATFPYNEDDLMGTKYGDK